MWLLAPLKEGDKMFRRVRYHNMEEDKLWTPVCPSSAIYTGPNQDLSHVLIEEIVVFQRNFKLVAVTF